MERRPFSWLTVLTVIFQVICVIALVFGCLFVLAASLHTSDIDRSIAPLVRLIGMGLALYGLTGLVFSGGIHVLISMDAQLRALSGTAPSRIPHAPGTDFRSEPVPPAAAGPRSFNCPRCGAPNDPTSRFCEACGNALTTG